LHSKDIVHGDLHPNNILFDAGQARIADYGLLDAFGESRRPFLQTAPASHTRDDATGEVEQVAKCVSGCPKYWSCDEPSKEDDVWAFGCLIMDIVLTWRDELWRNASRKTVLRIFRRREAELASVRLDNLVGRCLDENPEARITIEGVHRELGLVCPKEFFFDYLSARHPIVWAEVVGTTKDWKTVALVLMNEGYLRDDSAGAGAATVLSCCFFLGPDRALVELRLRRPFTPDPPVEAQQDAAAQVEETGPPDITAALKGDTLVITFANLPDKWDQVVPKLIAIADAHKDRPMANRA
jgi:hypothetical protein